MDMQTYSISYFKSHLLSLLDDFEKNNDTILITKWGKPIAEVIPHRKQDPSRNLPGTLSGTVIEEKDIMTPFGEEEWKLQL